ncbi:MAG: TetR/AcrR family transcriptional regulator, partial [Gammaproteobacteria bacterium]|jgi:AcrR family transcriptional regulator
MNRLSDTRERILSAAERLFASGGVTTTSLRTITDNARVNLAAVSYHFGSKDGLIEAVYRRRLGPLSRRQLDNLDRLEAQAGEHPLELCHIVEAFILPFAELDVASPEEAEVYSRLLAQTYGEAGSYFERIFSDEYSNLFTRYKKALHRALPELAPDLLCMRLHFLMGALNHTLAGAHLRRFMDATAARQSLDQALRQLVPFLVAGLQASTEIARPPATTA